MTWFGLYVGACALLVVAGILEVARPAATTLALTSLFPRLGRLPARAVVRSAAGLEAILGLGAFVLPRWPLAATVAVVYSGFAGFAWYARRRGAALATCGCFGMPDTPPTRAHVMLDVALVACAAGAAAWMGHARPGGTVLSLLATQPAHGIPLLASSGVFAGLAFLCLTSLARLGAARRMIGGGPGAVVGRGPVARAAHAARTAPAPAGGRP